MNFQTRITAEARLVEFPDTPHGPIGLIYPNTYNVGMASLGFQQVYRLFSESGFSSTGFLDLIGRLSKMRCLA